MATTGGELTTEEWIHKHQDWLMYVYALGIDPCPLICRYAGRPNSCLNDDGYETCVKKNTLLGNRRDVEFDYDSGIRAELP